MIVFSTRSPLPGLSKKVRTIVRPHFGKMAYLLCGWSLRGAIRAELPDVVHVMYASGFGLLASTWLHRGSYVLSMLGSDIFDFPKTRVRRWILRRNLAYAGMLLSTSEMMRREAGKIHRRHYRPHSDNAVRRGRRCLSPQQRPPPTHSAANRHSEAARTQVRRRHLDRSHRAAKTRRRGGRGTANLRRRIPEGQVDVARLPTGLGRLRKVPRLAAAWSNAAVPRRAGHLLCAKSPRERELLRCRARSVRERPCRWWHRGLAVCERPSWMGRPAS